MKQALISLIVEHNNAFDKSKYIIFPLPIQAQNLTKKYHFLCFSLIFNGSSVIRYCIFSSIGRLSK